MKGVNDIFQVTSKEVFNNVKNKGDIAKDYWFVKRWSVKRCCAIDDSLAWRHEASQS
jgi:hypothetical protein